MNAFSSLLDNEPDIKGGIDLSTPDGRFAQWLGKQTNIYSDACSAYARAEQESPPAYISHPQQVFSVAWDSYCILVAGDERYRKSRELAEFIDGYQTFDAEGVELYSVYVNTVLSATYGYSDHHVKALNEILAKLEEIIG